MIMDLPKVLFVDDQAEVLDDLRVIVAEVCDPYTATNAEEGLKIFENDGPFTIVASDQILPGINGAEFLTKVAEGTLTARPCWSPGMPIITMRCGR